MKGTLYGYLIGDDIQVDIKASTVTRVHYTYNINLRSAEAIFLGATPLALLAYLLERAEAEVVTYSDILHDIWDMRGMVSSYKRMGQIVKELREKLVLLGLPADVISTVRGVGYRLALPEVTRLYRETGVTTYAREFSLGSL